MKEEAEKEEEEKVAAKFSIRSMPFEVYPSLKIELKVNCMLGNAKDAVKHAGSSMADIVRFLSLYLFA